MNTQTIKQAIQNKKLMQFWYHNNQRIAEPHVFGVTTNDKLAVLTRQVGGYSSSGGLPDWRMFYVDEINNLRITEQSFQISRTWHNPRESDFKTIYAVVG